MASLLDDPAIVLARLSVERYHHMIEAGVLDEDDPFELYEGVLVEKMPEGPNHADRISAIAEMIFGLLLTMEWRLRVQHPITTIDSEPEPDLAIVARARYAAAHPGPSDIAVVIEVAESSLARDRSTKQRIYARAGIARYVIVDLVDDAVEVYTEPVAGADPHYASRQVVRVGSIDLGPITVDATDLLT
jgi:Uma2 family endonuclease